MKIKILLLSAVFFIAFAGSSLALNAKVYFLNAGNNEYVFYADNLNFCPLQILVNFKNSDGIVASTHLPFYAKLKAQEKGLYLFSVITYQNPSNSLACDVEEAIGDPDITPDQRYVYFIPYEEGTTHMINQGYNGRISHRGWIQYSLDFGMQIGTPVCAARDGVVVEVKQDSYHGGFRFWYMNMANYITVYHSDGSFSEYLHLMQNGSAVKVGDIIKKGQVIGYSGNTGFTTGPHLHFMVFKAVTMGRQTVPTLFLGPNDSQISLISRRYYEAFHSVTQVAKNSITNNSTNSADTDANLGGL
ncbi:MAG: M23 family metallopeptidase [Brevinematales bacterium]|jgi:murein DD-endopeptidase MepM/ murein hydrolase activator NlpD